MKNEEVRKHRESRVRVIDSIKNPLGFFVLVLLVVEAIPGVIVARSAGGDRTLAIAGMLIIIGGLVLIVAFIAYHRPSHLLNQPASAAIGPGPDELNRKTNIEGTYYAENDLKYEIKMTRLTGDSYRLKNPDWDGHGFFDGEYYYGVFKFNNKATPAKRRSNFGLHRAKLQSDGSFRLFGIELNMEKQQVGQFTDAVVGWVRSEENA